MPRRFRKAYHGLFRPFRPQHFGRRCRTQSEVRRHGVPRHHLCRHHTVRKGERVGGIPRALCAHQLPQQPVRGGRHHQRGRSRVRAVRGEEVRRHLRPRKCGGDPQLYARDVRRARQDDPGQRQPHPLRRTRHHGGGRGRPRACQTAARTYIRHRLSPRHRGGTQRQSAQGSRPAGRRTRAHRGDFQERFRQECGAGIRGRGHSRASRRVPQRHRRHDDGKHLSQLRLDDGRQGEGLSFRLWQGRGFQTHRP